MKKLFFIGSLFVTICCSTASSPRAMTESLWEKLRKGNYTEATEFMIEHANFSPQTAPEKLEQMKGFLQTVMSMSEQQTDEREGIRKVEVIEEAIDEQNQIASVKVRVTYGNGETDEQESEFSRGADGAWKFGAKQE